MPEYLLTNCVCLQDMLRYARVHTHASINCWPDVRANALNTVYVNPCATYANCVQCAHIATIAFHSWCWQSNSRSANQQPTRTTHTHMRLSPMQFYDAFEVWYAQYGPCERRPQMGVRHAGFSLRMCVHQYITYGVDVFANDDDSNTDMCFSRSLKPQDCSRAVARNENRLQTLPALGWVYHWQF